MKVLVLGGSGLIGQRVVRLLGELGHQARDGSRSTGVDAVTGDGLAEAVAGVDAVVDVTNPPPDQLVTATTFFTTVARNALEAEERAGVGHHLRRMPLVGLRHPHQVPRSACPLRPTPRRGRHP